MVSRKRPPIVIWIVPLLVGFAGFNRVTQSPSFAMYATWTSFSSSALARASARLW
jgi:hypothetical protein